jgi:hypothetical protein
MNGVAAGSTQDNDDLYFGKGKIDSIFTPGYIRIEAPSGLIAPIRGVEGLSAVKGDIFYLVSSDDNDLDWVDSSSGSSVDYAVEFCKTEYGTACYYGKITEGAKEILGTVISYQGAFFFVNPQTQKTEKRTSGYQVLTCKSSKSKFLLRYFYGISYVIHLCYR